MHITKTRGFRSPFYSLPAPMPLVSPVGRLLLQTKTFWWLLAFPPTAAGTVVGYQHLSEQRGFGHTRIAAHSKTFRDMDFHPPRLQKRPPDGKFRLVCAVASGRALVCCLRRSQNSSHTKTWRHQYCIAVARIGNRKATLNSMYGLDALLCYFRAYLCPLTRQGTKLSHHKRLATEYHILSDICRPIANRFLFTPYAD